LSGGHPRPVTAARLPPATQQTRGGQTPYLAHSMLAPDGTLPGARRPAAPLLRVTSVNTFYGKSHVLHGVSLDVFPGEFVALLGRNGAGKTTTLATITGVVPPRDGRIAYRAADVAGRPPEEIAR